MFTVEEANRLLPRVKALLAELRQRQVRIQKLEREKAVEELSWLREDGTVSPRAKAAVARLEEEQRAQGKAFEEALERLGRIGAQLKALEAGLVDFLTPRGEELVCLCWKEGEEAIQCWHDLESGFSGRRPISQL
jgi:hypothetical protein